ncbi:unnamed protein product [Vitrella brassicaformis CCMP3155]|uniref:Uncharacterized protein n=1 Tax=Vitrella brassicaformis (strain CCMP3155) TaxID=1169540 RepID=A0A0G4H0Q6_VITBC|nr:unnamed protein product [Vitrella brassicaformis CCMP3155]|eukprot:CEM37154.1 unnamed protein product [Vitrella brassicaformis CCMP3155]
MRRNSGEEGLRYSDIESQQSEERENEEQHNFEGDVDVTGGKEDYLAEKVDLLLDCGMSISLKHRMFCTGGQGSVPIGAPGNKIPSVQPWLVQVRHKKKQQLVVILSSWKEELLRSLFTMVERALTPYATLQAQFETVPPSRKHS